MDSCEEDDRRLLPRARQVPKEMDALDVPLLERLAGCEDSRYGGVPGGELVKEMDV